MYKVWTAISAFMIFATSGIKSASIEFDTINVSTELVKGRFEKKGASSGQSSTSICMK